MSVRNQLGFHGVKRVTDQKKLNTNITSSSHYCLEVFSLFFYSFWKNNFLSFNHKAFVQLNSQSVNVFTLL